MTVAVRAEDGAAEVRALAKAATTPEQARRLLAIALVLEGASRAEAARSTGMDRQTLRSIAARSTGAPFQRRRADGPGRPQGAGSAPAAGPEATAGVGALSGERPRAGTRRGGTLAPGRSLRPVSRADRAAGMAPRPCACRTTSPCCRCRPTARSSTRSKTCGSSSSTTSSTPASSRATARSLRPAAPPGTASRAIPGQIRSITTRDWAKTVNL